MKNQNKTAMETGARDVLGKQGRVGTICIMTVWLAGK